MVKFVPVPNEQRQINIFFPIFKTSFSTLLLYHDIAFFFLLTLVNDFERAYALPMFKGCYAYLRTDLLQSSKETLPSDILCGIV